MADHPNVARLKKGYEAFASADMETLSDLFADDIVWHVPGSSPISGDYKGQEEVFGFFMRIGQETGGTFGFDMHDMLSNDDHAVVLADVHAERNGKTMNQKNVHIFHINDAGKVTEFWGMAEDSAATDDFWS